MTALRFLTSQLGCHDVFQFRFDLKGREAGGVPSAAEGFDEKSAGDQFLAANDGHLLLVVQQILLGIDDVEVADEAASVAAFRDGKGAARGVDSVLLGLLRFIQNEEAVDVILHFTEGAKDSLAVGGYACIIAGFSELVLRAAGSTGENAFRGVGTDSPKRALDVQQFCDVGRLPAAVAKKIQRREVGGAGDADLCVGDGHFAFGLGDVRAAFEEVRRQSGVDGGRLGVEFFGGKVEIRRGLSHQDGDGVFELFALLLQEDRLCARGVEKRFFLGDVEAGGDAAFVARVYKFKALGERVHCPAEYSNLGVHLAQREIIASKFGGDDKARVFKIGAAGLIGSLRGFDGAATAAEKVDFVAYGKGQGEGGLADGAS